MIAISEPWSVKMGHRGATVIEASMTYDFFLQETDLA